MHAVLLQWYLYMCLHASVLVQRSNYIIFSKRAGTRCYIYSTLGPTIAFQSISSVSCVACTCEGSKCVGAHSIWIARRPSHAFINIYTKNKVTHEKEQLTQEDELVSHETVKASQTASRNSLQLCRMAVHCIWPCVQEWISCNVIMYKRTYHMNYIELAAFLFAGLHPHTQK